MPATMTNAAAGTQKPGWRPGRPPLVIEHRAQARLPGAAGRARRWRSARQQAHSATRETHKSGKERNVVAKQHEAGACQHAAQGQQQDGRIDVDFRGARGSWARLEESFGPTCRPPRRPRLTASPNRKGSTCPVQATTPAASMDTSIGLNWPGARCHSSASTAAKSSDRAPWSLDKYPDRRRLSQTIQPGHDRAQEEPQRHACRVRPNPRNAAWDEAHVGGEVAQPQALGPGQEVTVAMPR